MDLKFIGLFVARFESTLNLTRVDPCRAVRISLIALGGIILLLGLITLYIDSELKPEPLGKR
jgi:hypothetical protein